VLFFQVIREMTQVMMPPRGKTEGKSRTILEEVAIGK
jgi:hypothetical protein